MMTVTREIPLTSVGPTEMELMLTWRRERTPVKRLRTPDESRNLAVNILRIELHPQHFMIGLAGWNHRKDMLAIGNRYLN